MDLSNISALDKHYRKQKAWRKAHVLNDVDAVLIETMFGYETYDDDAEKLLDKCPDAKVRLPGLLKVAFIPKRIKHFFPHMETVYKGIAKYGGGKKLMIIKEKRLIL